MAKLLLEVTVMSAPSSKVSHDKQRVILCWKPDKTIVSSIENLLYWVCGIRQWIGCYVKDEIWITWVGTKLVLCWYNGYITVSTLQKKDTRYHAPACLPYCKLWDCPPANTEIYCLALWSVRSRSTLTWRPITSASRSSLISTSQRRLAFAGVQMWVHSFPQSSYMNSVEYFEHHVITASFPCHGAWERG